MSKNDAIACLKKHNYKVTPQREVIIEIFCKSKGFIPVKEVYKLVKEVFPQISLDTVYRNLEILRDINILNSTIVGNNTLYEMKKEAHKHTMKCIKCGNTYDIDICPLDYCINEIGDFKILDHKFEISGICKKCRNAK